MRARRRQRGCGRIVCVPVAQCVAGAGAVDAAVVDAAAVDTGAVDAAVVDAASWALERWGSGGHWSGEHWSGEHWAVNRASWVLDRRGARFPWVPVEGGPASGRGAAPLTKVRGP